MSEMNELFYRDAYAREFSAEVVSCTQADEDGKDFEVVLSDTAFYPEGGGQPADHGTLNGAAVFDVRRIKGVVVHHVDREFAVGATVKGVLDWERRYDNMQNHTGEHVISGLVHGKYGFDNVGFHMDDDAITVDFDGIIPPEEVAGIEKAVNDAILADIPVGILYPSADELKAMTYRSKKELSGKVRIVDIPGCDRCACCGTHVAKTGEVGLLKILSFERHRGGTRIVFVCGARAIRDYARKNASVKRVSELLSAKPAEIAQAVERLLESSAARDREIAELKKSLLAVRAQAVPADARIAVCFEEGLTPQDLRTFATAIVEAGRAPAAAVLSERAPDEFSYVIHWPSDGLRDVSRTLNQKLNGRGGGSGGYVQGTYRASAEVIRETVGETFAAL